MKKNINEIQLALKELGIYTGNLDGITGPQTKLAVRQFQAINSLVIDGIPGPNTLGALFPAPIPGRDDVGHGDMVTPHQSEVRSFYGKIGENQVLANVAYPLKLAWDHSRLIHKFSCHKLVKANMENIFAWTLAHYGLDRVQELRLDLFGGCFNVRKMRGGTKYSMHSWGIAVDLNPTYNQLKWDKNKAHFARKEYLPFWQIVEANGATSLGRAKDYDWMHFQFASV